QRKRRQLVRRVRELDRALAGQRVLDRTVHQQVRVATDRRGEVRVRSERKAEVADVLRRVHRQRLAAQDHRLQQRRVGTLADLLQQVAEVLRLELAPRRQAQL